MLIEFLLNFCELQMKRVVRMNLHVQMDVAFSNVGNAIVMMTAAMAPMSSTVRNRSAVTNMNLNVAMAFASPINGDVIVNRTAMMGLMNE